MLSKTHVMRLLMLVEQALDDDFVEYALAVSSRYDNLIQLDLFDDENNVREDELKNRILQTYSNKRLDMELKNILTDGIRSIKFREEAEQILSKLKEDIKLYEPYPTGMGKVLPFEKRG